MKETNPGKNNHPLLNKESPWENNANAIWLGSTISLSRNLEKFNFPGKLTTDKRKQILSLLSKDLLASKFLKKPKLIRGEDIPSIEKEYLVEHFLSNQSFHQAHSGEAFVLDQTGEFLAVLNLRDHLLLSAIDAREELESTWDKLVKIELEINKTASYAFSRKFGFLTSDPAQAGTGLLVTIFLHLPALIYSDRLVEIIKKNKEEGVEQTGLQGDPNEIIGDIIAFHNSHTIGVTEENILASMRMLATKLVVEEKGIRQQFKHESESKLAEVKDKVSRAYALLMHSYQIEAKEALQEISLVKLGIDLGWLKGANHAKLNTLLFSCRRAHILCKYGKISQEELPHKRAEFIHKTLHGLELLI